MAGMGAGMKNRVMKSVGLVLLGTLLASTVAFVSSVQVLAAPSVTITPTSGPVGTKVTIRITGWKPNVRFGLVWFATDANVKAVDQNIVGVTPLSWTDPY